MSEHPLTDATGLQVIGGSHWIPRDFAYKLEDERALLRGALAKIVGVSDKRELEAFEATIRLLPMAAEDRAQILDGIHALRATG